MGGANRGLTPPAHPRVRSNGNQRIGSQPYFFFLAFLAPFFGAAFFAATFLAAAFLAGAFFLATGAAFFAAPFFIRLPARFFAAFLAVAFFAPPAVFGLDLAEAEAFDLPADFLVDLAADALAAEKMFRTLMGDEVEGRREFILRHRIDDPDAIDYGGA